MCLSVINAALIIALAINPNFLNTEISIGMGALFLFIMGVATATDFKNILRGK